MKNTGKNSFVRGMSLVMTFLALTGLVLLFSVPVITAGPALTAGYYVALKAVEGSEYKIWQGFWHSFRQNLKQGIVLGLIVFVPCGLLLFALQHMYENGGYSVPYILVLLVYVLIAASAVYVFPLLSRFDNTVIDTLRIAVSTAFHFLTSTIIMTTGLLLALMLAQNTVWWILLPLLPLWLYATSYIDAPIFAALIAEKNKHEEGGH
jgi:uncharacterized membrane protein YesL